MLSASAGDAEESDVLAVQRARYQQLRALETYKNDLIEELFDHCEQLHKVSNRNALDVQRKDIHLLNSDSTDERDDYVLMLNDLDHVQIPTAFISQGAAGGARAVTALQLAVSDYIQTHLRTLSSTFLFVARFYMDFEAANQRWNDDYPDCDNGARRDIVMEFATAFSSTSALVDMINIGKDLHRMRISASDKIVAALQLHLRDTHCRHVFIGCKPNLFMRSMQQRDFPLPEGKITFIKGFRQGDLPYTLVISSDQPEDSHCSAIEDSTIKAGTFPLARAVCVPSPVSTQTTRASARMPSSSSSFSEDAMNTKVPSRTWASTAATAPALSETKVETLPHRARGDPKSVGLVARNRLGQRVDPAIKYDKDSADRVKRLKLCNVHYLRRECPYGDACCHVHDYKPTTAELDTLRLVARMSNCKDGSDCEDVKCIFGHCCPAPIGRFGWPCLFAAQCRYPKELHNIDRKIVNGVKP